MLKGRLLCRGSQHVTDRQQSPSVWRSRPRKPGPAAPLQERWLGAARWYWLQAGGTCTALQRENNLLLLSPQQRGLGRQRAAKHAHLSRPSERGARCVPCSCTFATSSWPSIAALTAFEEAHKLQSAESRSRTVKCHRRRTAYLSAGRRPLPPLPASSGIEPHTSRRHTSTAPARYRGSKG